MQGTFAPRLPLVSSIGSENRGKRPGDVLSQTLLDPRVTKSDLIFPLGYCDGWRVHHDFGTVPLKTPVPNGTHGRKASALGSVYQYAAGKEMVQGRGGPKKGPLDMARFSVVATAMPLVPRPAPARVAAALARLQWPPPSREARGMLARIEKLRENAVKVHQQLKEQRMMIQELRGEQQQLLDAPVGFAAVSEVAGAGPRLHQNLGGRRGNPSLFPAEDLVLPGPSTVLRSVDRGSSLPNLQNRLSPLPPRSVAERPRKGLDVSFELQW